MAQQRHVRPGYTVIRPNRDRVVCKVTRALVVLVLLVSVALMLTVTVGGWSKLEGMTPINFAWSAIYVVLAFFIARWARGLLPIAAALGVLLLAITAIASLGVTGTSWFDRSHGAYAGAHALGGGAGLSASVLGTFVVVLMPVELVLVVIAIVGFGQGWNVEQEVADSTLSGGPPRASVTVPRRDAPAAR